MQDFCISKKIVISKITVKDFSFLKKMVLSSNQGYFLAVANSRSIGDPLYVSSTISANRSDKIFSDF